MKWNRTLSLLFVFFFSLSSIAQANNSFAITRGGAVLNTRNVSSSTAWVEVVPSFERGLDVHNPSGSGVAICLVRSTPECGTIADVTSCPISLSAGATFEFLAEVDRYNGRICARRASGSGAVSLGLGKF